MTRFLIQRAHAMRPPCTVPKFIRTCRSYRLIPALALAACALAMPDHVSMPVNAAGEPSATAVIGVYADIAEASYADAYTAALALQEAIDNFLAAPTQGSLETARKAWIAAREPYMQTEVYRFGNKMVDMWEGKVNAWPLDEGLIDYVERSYVDTGSENELYIVNVIANPVLKIGGKNVDASSITPELLVRHLHEAGGIEANVATGYHAIEFLLWGQDRNGTGAGAGQRPATDFDSKACTGGNCDRRAQYLRVATRLLVENLNWMKGAWSKVGAARRTVTEGGDAAGLTAIFTGLGSLTYGELAGERMQLGLLLNDPEEEHDCFSDNTHNSHYYDLIGIRNIYLGRYQGLDGSIVAGASVSDLVRAKSPEADDRIRTALEEAVSKMNALKQRAETVERYDQMLGEDNAEGNAVIQQAIDALVVLAKSYEPAIASLGLSAIAFEGSDSLDKPDSIVR